MERVKTSSAKQRTVHRPLADIPSFNAICSNIASHHLWPLCAYGHPHRHTHTHKYKNVYIYLYFVYLYLFIYFFTYCSSIIVYMFLISMNVYIYIHIHTFALIHKLVLCVTLIVYLCVYISVYIPRTGLFPFLVDRHGFCQPNFPGSQNTVPL